MIRSFRDPSGSCWLTDKKVFRILDEASAAGCDAFLATDSGKRFLEEKKLVSTRRISAAEASANPDVPPALRGKCPPGTAVLFEHEKIPFPSYPYEWPPEMLWEAGRLTLELARTPLHDGYCLKDATPFNVLFRGPQPVFVDVPSFELRAPGDPVWRPYAQFVRTFLLPLLANDRWSLKMADIFTTRRDGLEPEDVYRLCGLLARLKPQMLSLVSLPTWLGSDAKAKRPGFYETRLLKDVEKAQFILESVLARLSRSLEKLRPARARNSTWSDYMGTHSYDEPAFQAKEQFVTDLLNATRPARVLDAGANTGHFSALAAKAGAAVVAIDLDEACVGSIWQRAAAESLNILPLVINLSRPSAALGWRNCECASFLERASEGFDCVLMLALIHHLLVTERVPLDEVLSLAAELTTSHAIIELVLPQDEMFQRLTRGREHLHRDLSEASFEAACRKQFEIVKSTAVPGTHRKLYCLRKGPKMATGGAQQDLVSRG